MARVLIVEDDADTRRLLRRRLASTSNEVDDVATGELALAALDRSTYDLIVLDVNLPGIQGWEVIRAVAASERLASVPVLLCTITEPEDAPPGVEAVGWLAKPFTRGDLDLAVNLALGGPD